MEKKETQKAKCGSQIFINCCKFAPHSLIKKLGTRVFDPVCFNLLGTSGWGGGMR